MKRSYFLVGLLVAVVVTISFIGGSWSTGYADTVPTLPTVPTIPGANSLTPTVVQVGGPQFEVTITGSNFIDSTYTLVRWLGPDLQYIYLTTTSVSTDGKTLTATVPASLIQQMGTAYLWVVNHPGTPDEIEVAGPLYLNIKELFFVPLVSK